MPDAVELTERKTLPLSYDVGILNARWQELIRPLVLGMRGGLPLKPLCYVQLIPMQSGLLQLPSLYTFGMGTVFYDVLLQLLR